MKAGSTASLAILAASAVLAASPARPAAPARPAESPALAEGRRVLAQYLEAFNAGDAARMDALYADDIVLHLSGGRPPLVGRQALRQVDDFHAVARPHTELSGVGLHEEEGGRVRVSTTGFSEVARPFQALGIPRLPRLMPAGTVRLDGETGPLWIEAMHEWRTTTGLRHDPAKLAECGGAGRPDSGP